MIVIVKLMILKKNPEKNIAIPNVTKYFCTFLHSQDMGSHTASLINMYIYILSNTKHNNIKYNISHYNTTLKTVIVFCYTILRYYVL